MLDALDPLELDLPRSIELELTRLSKEPMDEGGHHDLAAYSRDATRAA